MADSYIGSFLSVISKSEIRYEGTLYNLDPRDSTIALQNVRSYGTEGRKTNGPQVPPNDQVYQYILFRGSDIKDLQVKTVQPAQVEDQLHDDPAIIKTNHHGDTSSSSVSPGNETLADLKAYGELSAPKTVPYPSLSPPSYSTNNVMPSNGIPSQWQGYNAAAPGSINTAQQLPLSSTRNLSNQVSPAHVTGTFSSSSYFNASSGPTSEHFPMPITASLSSSLPPYYNSTLANYNGLTMPFPVTTSTIEAPVVDKLDLVPKPMSLLPTKSPLYSSPFVSEPIPEPFSLQQPTFLTPNQFSQPRLSEYSLSNNLYSGQIDISSNPSSTTMTHGVQPPLLPLSSTPMTQGVQSPLLPLPPPSQKITEEFDFQAMNEKFNKNEVWGSFGKANQRNNMEGLQNYGANRRDAGVVNPDLGATSEPKFTEEFDFQAMNEKFKKDEVWGDLGKANQRNNSEGFQNYGASSNDAGLINPGLVSNSDPKPAYKKDDFFDTISCNSVGRGARNGQNQSSERIKLNSETFGNFQRPQFGYNGYGGRHGYNRGQYHRERGYNYHNWGRGGHMQG